MNKIITKSKNESSDLSPREPTNNPSTIFSFLQEINSRSSTLPLTHRSPKQTQAPHRRSPSSSPSHLDLNSNQHFIYQHHFNSTTPSNSRRTSWSFRTIDETNNTLPSNQKNTSSIIPNQQPEFRHSQDSEERNSRSNWLKNSAEQPAEQRESLPELLTTPRTSEQEYPKLRIETHRPAPLTLSSENNPKSLSPEEAQSFVDQLNRVASPISRVTKLKKIPFSNISPPGETRTITKRNIIRNTPARNLTSSRNTNLFEQSSQSSSSLPSEPISKQSTTPSPQTNIENKRPSTQTPEQHTQSCTLL